MSAPQFETKNITDRQPDNITSGRVGTNTATIKVLIKREKLMRQGNANNK